MTSRLSHITLILALLACSKLFAQEKNVLSQSTTYFGGYQLRSSGINPSEFEPKSQWESNLLYKGFTGDFSEINIWSFQLARSISKDESTAQIAGLSAYSEREGPYYRKSRVYGRYALEVPLNPSLKLKAGAEFGIINVAFGGASTQSNASSSSISSNLGILLSSQQWNLGIGLRQILNQELRPFMGALPFQRNINLLVSYWSNQEAPYWVELKSWSRYFNENEWMTNLMVSLQSEKFIVGLQGGYRDWIWDGSVGHFTPLLGIKDLKFGSTSLSISFSYHLSLPPPGVPAFHQIESSLFLRIQ